MCSMASKAIQEEFQQELEDGPYIAVLRTAMNRMAGYPKGASKVLDFLYLGSCQEANDVDLLKRMGITHVINCAEGYVRTDAAFYGPKIYYYGFDAEDDDNYNIMQHFPEVYNRIEEARTSGGKVLIHCIMGVNRSAALAVAYVMLHKNLGPIGASKMVLKARRCILSNCTFQRQLISFGRQKNMLHLDDSELKHRM